MCIFSHYTIPTFPPPPSARHYNSDLSIWLSVDPMADKYPSMSPYTYCGNNPVGLVDEDGREIGYVDEAVQEKINALIDKNSPDYCRAFARVYRRLERSKQLYNFYDVSSNELPKDELTGKHYFGLFSHNLYGDANFRIWLGEGVSIQGLNGGNNIYSNSESQERTSEKGGFNQRYTTLFEETYHAADYDRGRLDYDNPTCMDEARAWKFATKAPHTKMLYVFLGTTFAGLIAEGTTIQNANLLHDGEVGTDFEGIWHVLRGKNGGGVFENLPLKKKNQKK